MDGITTNIKKYCKINEVYANLYFFDIALRWENLDAKTNDTLHTL